MVTMIAIIITMTMVTMIAIIITMTMVTMVATTTMEANSHQNIYVKKKCFL